MNTAMDAKEAAKHSNIRRALRERLDVLKHYCLPPGGDDGPTLWPSQNELEDLDWMVESVFLLERKRLPDPRWKAYKRADKRLPKYYDLVSTVEKMVERAGERLKEVRESELNRFMRKADQSGQRTQSELVHRLLGIAYGDPHFKAANIQWEDYEQLLFRGDNNKPVQLACGDLPGDRRLRCYARALEIVADDMRFRPFRDKVQSIATWVLHMGNPDLVKMLGYYELESVSEHRARQHADEARKHKQEQSKKRQKKHRDKKRRAELLARGISEADIEEIFAGNA